MDRFQNLSQLLVTGSSVVIFNKNNFPIPLTKSQLSFLLRTIELQFQITGSYIRSVHVHVNCCMWQSMEECYTYTITFVLVWNPNKDLFKDNSRIYLCLHNWTRCTESPFSFLKNNSFFSYHIFQKSSQIVYKQYKKGFEKYVMKKKGDQVLSTPCPII